MHLFARADSKDMSIMTCEVRDPFISPFKHSGRNPEEEPGNSEPNGQQRTFYKIDAFDFFYTKRHHQNTLYYILYIYFKSLKQSQQFWKELG